MRFSGVEAVTMPRHDGLDLEEVTDHQSIRFRRCALRGRRESHEGVPVHVFRLGRLQDRVASADTRDAASRFACAALGAKPFILILARVHKPKAIAADEIAAGRVKLDDRATT